VVGNRYVPSPLETKVKVGIPLTRVDEGRGRSPAAAPPADNMDVRR